MLHRCFVAWCEDVHGPQLLLCDGSYSDEEDGTFQETLCALASTSPSAAHMSLATGRERTSSAFPAPRGLAFATQFCCNDPNCTSPQPPSPAGSSTDGCSEVEPESCHQQLSLHGSAFHHRHGMLQLNPPSPPPSPVRASPPTSDDDYSSSGEGEACKAANVAKRQQRREDRSPTWSTPHAAAPQPPNDAANSGVVLPPSLGEPSATSPLGACSRFERWPMPNAHTYCFWLLRGLCLLICHRLRRLHEGPCQHGEA